MSFVHIRWKALDTVSVRGSCWRRWRKRRRKTKRRRRKRRKKTRRVMLLPLVR
jgi:hypothetical protein